MPKRTLLTGVAYHGNRMLSHAVADMREIAQADMDVVVHMLSQTDRDRHKTVMKDIFAATEDAGLEVWVDCWGLGGPPGDVSNFLAYHPECHAYFSNGELMAPYACLNHPTYRDFVKGWIDDVYEMGARTIFWDEPHLGTKKAENGEILYGCSCPTCKKLFEERYNRPMPRELDEDVIQFRTDTIVDYLGTVSTYAALHGMTNAVCVMFVPELGSNLDLLDRICTLPNMHNVGSDPYWYGQEGAHPYEYVYSRAKATVEMANKCKKDHNVWIQTYNVPRGREEEIIEATAAAYDAGARTLLAWGYHGSESNTYRAKNPMRTWDLTIEAMKRVRAMERDRILEENRKRFMK